MALYPVDEYTLTFHGNDRGRNMSFDITEAKQSRDLQFTNNIIYNVIVNPHNDTLMSDFLWSGAERIAQNFISDELIIAWNVWYFAGDTFLDNYLAKKWPPECKKIGANQYQVVISYAPLFLSSFQILPIKTKRFTDLGNTFVLEFPPEGGSVSPVSPGEMGQHEEEYHSYINVDDDGKVQGVDVIEPTFTWTERWQWGPQSDLWVGVTPDNYLRELAKMTATTNTTPFRGFAAEEVLFRGASGRHVSHLLFEIDYSFAMRPNRDTIKHGNIDYTLPPGLKSGWLIKDETLTDVAITIRHDRKLISRVPLFMRLHQVYEVEDFDKLNIIGKLKLNESQHFGGGPNQINTLPSIGPPMSPPILAVVS